jgi:hypothetical protein
LRLALLPLLLLSACDACDKTPSSTPRDAAPEATEAGSFTVAPLPSASVAAMVNPDNLPAYAGPTGSVEGTIKVTGAPPAATPADFGKCPEAEAIYGHAFREGPNRTLADAVVVITGYKGFFVPEKNEAKTIGVRGCGYETRTLTITIGQRIDVKNVSKDFWTPMLEPSPPGLVMMAIPGGEAIHLLPRKIGYFRVVDRDRKYAFVEAYAFRHSLHTVTSAEGTYRIDGVPVGKVKVNAMHPAIDGAEASKDIEVRENAATRVDLELTNKPPKSAGDPKSPSPPLH